MWDEDDELYDEIAKCRESVMADWMGSPLLFWRTTVCIDGARPSHVRSNVRSALFRANGRIGRSPAEALIEVQDDKIYIPRRADTADLHVHFAGSDCPCGARVCGLYSYGLFSDGL